MGFVNAMVSGNKYLVFLRKSYKVVDYSVVRDNEFFVNTKKMDDLMKSLKADAMKKYPKKKIVSVSKKGLIHALKKGTCTIKASKKCKVYRYKVVVKNKNN